MKEYNSDQIEAKWQQYWENNGEFAPDSKSGKTPFYMLTMLPYPSGDLHIGHWYAMTPSDAIARFTRMQGHEVFFPIGFDAFGLPAENAAIKNNIHPKEWTYKNMERMRIQLRSMGNMFAWKNEIASCDPEYYRWNQWFFLKMREMGLAYREFSPVDYCTHCKTTLAREQVHGDDRVCERCDTPVIKKELNQWKLRITDYAEELLEFDGLDWPERVKTMQTHWIGKSEGVEFALKIAGNDELNFRVFTTRPDTVFGMSFCVLAPEHELVSKITTAECASSVQAYQENAVHKNEIERTAEGKEKDGVFTGAYAINPMNGESIPIWIADYVLASYGTGAIMAVPAHDTRDFAFAKKYQLPIPIAVIPKEMQDNIPETDSLSEALTSKEDSVMVNSSQFTGLSWPESFKQVAQHMEDARVGELQVHYRLRDWLISRQRMWGTPIPIIYCENCGTLSVPYENLPVVLPDDAEFLPTGESPLKSHQGFLKTPCPKCGMEAERETDTMDTFVCSSWYQYAYLSPEQNREKATLNAEDSPWTPEDMARWGDVDLYTGGIEHATMHLLYFRFFTKAMADMGILDFKEPAKRLFNQGMILGEDHEKMSKSRGNVVNPDDLVQKYGADTIRAYLMFLGPWESGAPWNSNGIEGVSRFLKGVWSLCLAEGSGASISQKDEASLRKALHQTLKKVTHEYKAFKFNTVIAALMSFRNTLKAYTQTAPGNDVWKECMDGMLLMLAPIAPHITEELWSILNPDKGSIHRCDWPAYDDALTKEASITLIVQINGKLRARLELPASLDAKEIEVQALAAPKVQDHLKGKTIRKVIVVRNKLVNIVV